jgi:hypothetical protein
MELRRRWARPTDGRCGVRGHSPTCSASMSWAAIPSRREVHEMSVGMRDQPHRPCPLITQSCRT